MRARVILYNKENKAVLLIHRFKNGRNYWVIPGGGAKGHETPIDTAIREINEELSIHLKPTDLMHFLNMKKKSMRNSIMLKFHILLLLKSVVKKESGRAEIMFINQNGWPLKSCQRLI